MTLSEIRDWLKTFDLAENYYIGRLDNKKEKSLGVYDRESKEAPVMALGGAGLSSYGVKSVSLLLHGNRNARQTEEAAGKLWQAVAWAANIETPCGARIQYIRPVVPAPVSVGTDEGGVYEYVIEINIYYRR